MNENEEWVMRPVIRGLCKYESLLDGTISLVDLARMNDALDVDAENAERLRRANE
jgi:hypothetical protein